jgi:Tol biopolymer transport system component
LAKSAPKTGPAEETLATALTTEGTVLGTPQYMAPEQFEGKEADARSDVWAFGAVLYEMVTGQKAFQGKGYASLVGAILSADPAPMPVKTFTHAWLERLVRRCLAKDPEDRWQSMRDVVLELRTPMLEEPLEPEAQAASSAATSRRWPLLPWVVAGLAGILAAWGGFAAVWRQNATRTGPVTRLTLPLPFESLRGFSLSPDGRMLAYSAPSEHKPMVWLRALDGLEAQPRPGTEGGTYPFWSPDSESIGFFTGDGKLKRMQAAGGLPQVVAEVPVGQRVGASWSSTGVIIFTINSEGGLQRVAASGGRPEALTQPGPLEVGHKWPGFLPDGKRFIYFAEGKGNQATNPSKVYAASLDKPNQRVAILETNKRAVLAGGYLLHSPHGDLVAQRFDEDRLRLEGQPQLIADKVAFASALELHAAASLNGVLGYSSEAAGTGELVWVGRDGRTMGRVGSPGVYNAPQISPDGLKVVMGRDQLTLSAWIYDLARGVMTPLTDAPTFSARWSPDGEWIVYAAYTRNGRCLFRKRANGVGDEEQLTTGTNTQTPSQYTADGRFVLYTELDPVTKNDIWTVPLDGERRPRPFLRTRFSESQASISPDGRWVAYTSDENGSNEIYLQELTVELSPKGRKWLVSNAGGTGALWNRNGKELFYLSGAKLMAVTLTPGPQEMTVGSPRELFPAGIAYDVTADGQRFLVRRPLETPAALTIVTNWEAKLAK